MTLPTPEQLAAVLPRCEAGLDSGAWSDDADRLAWATKVLGWVEEAVGDAPKVHFDPEWIDQGHETGIGRALVDFFRAMRSTPHPQPEFRPDPELEALLDEEEAIYRATLRYERLYGGGDDRWEVREGTARLVASNDWPPPAKGTHESDLDIIHGTWGEGGCVFPDSRCIDEFEAAEEWSRSA